MAVTPRRAYLQARLQAGLARLPDATEWERLAGYRDFPGYLAAVRGTLPAAWLSEIGVRTGPLVIDLALRDRYQEELARLVAWSPAAWRPALAWLRWLPDLPLLEALAADWPLATWLADDPRFQACYPDPAAVLARLQPDVSRELAPTRFWWRQWQDLWPGMCAGERAGLDGLLERLVPEAGTCLGGVGAGAGPGIGLAGSWLRDRDLTHWLRALVRQRAFQPAAWLAYLAVLVQTLERLRAELTDRALFAVSAVESSPASP